METCYISNDLQSNLHRDQETQQYAHEILARLCTNNRLVNELLQQLFWRVALPECKNNAFVGREHVVVHTEDGLSLNDFQR